MHACQNWLSLRSGKLEYSVFHDRDVCCGHAFPGNTLASLHCMETIEMPMWT